MFWPMASVSSSGEGEVRRGDVSCRHMTGQQPLQGLRGLFWYGGGDCGSGWGRHSALRAALCRKGSLW